jgi:hypothetical protein
MDTSKLKVINGRANSDLKGVVLNLLSSKQIFKAKEDYCLSCLHRIQEIKLNADKMHMPIKKRTF